jgi:hypothetical protein
MRILAKPDTNAFLTPFAVAVVRTTHSCTAFTDQDGGRGQANQLTGRRSAGPRYVAGSVDLVKGRRRGSYMEPEDLPDRPGSGGRLPATRRR